MARMRAKERGLTLLELLIVMTILMMITAAAIPMMSVNAEKRRARETGQLVSSYIAGVRSRALVIGRPCGVMIERVNTGSSEPGNYAMRLSYVETPAPYGGEFADSMALLAAGVNPTSTRVQVADLGTNLNDAVRKQSDQESWAIKPRVGDLIKFNYSGRYFRLEADEDHSASGALKPGDPLPNLDPDAATPVRWNLVPLDGSNRLPDQLLTAGPVAYQFVRQPVAGGGDQAFRTLVPPLQLPDGVVIDLAVSGVGTKGYFEDYASGDLYPNPTIMFTPSGAVQYVYSGKAYSHPNGPIYLMIGLREGTDEVIPDNSNLMLDAHAFPNPSSTFDLRNVKNSKNGITNLLNPDNLWITIGHDTGMVTTTENASQTAAGDDPPLIKSFGKALEDAREFARTAQSLGGRR